MRHSSDSVSVLIVVALTALYLSSVSCSPRVKSLSILTNSTNSNTSEKSSYVDPRFTLKCHRREYTFKAVRYDDTGRKCWQYVTVMSCWGRCDSGEIADWRFPFKQSYHPICVHDKKRMRKIRLKYCETGVDESLRSYKVVDALTCRCRLCQSGEASCEGLPHISTRSV